MVIVSSFPTAVALCSATMRYRGSWANTEKMADDRQTWEGWPFQLFFWNYTRERQLLSRLPRFTPGCLGEADRGLISDPRQTEATAGLALRIAAR